MICDQLTAANYNQFLAQHDVAVVLFDATWDVAGGVAIQERYSRAREELSDKVGFGEIDVDAESALAKAIPILNVPAVVYYRNGFKLATLIGSSQNIAARIRRVMAGQLISYEDGLQ
jgi:thioredoxin-like negative regulator of GroEL